MRCAGQAWDCFSDGSLGKGAPCPQKVGCPLRAKLTLQLKPYAIPPSSYGIWIINPFKVHLVLKGSAAQGMYSCTRRFVQAQRLRLP